MLSNRVRVSNTDSLIIADRRVRGVKHASLHRLVLSNMARVSTADLYIPYVNVVTSDKDIYCGNYFYKACVKQLFFRKLVLRKMTRISL